MQSNLTNIEGEIVQLTSKAEGIDAIVNVYSAKNFLPYPYAQTTITTNGVTYTDNGDGSITMSGNSSSEGSGFNYAFDLKLKKGSYIFSGCPSSGGWQIYRQVLFIDDNYYGDYGDGVEFSISSDMNATVFIQVWPNVNIPNPVTFYPMLRDSRISDPTYTPYAMTNQELTAKMEYITFSDYSESINSALESAITRAEALEVYNTMIPLRIVLEGIDFFYGFITIYRQFGSALVTVYSSRGVNYCIKYEDHFYHFAIAVNS